MADPLSLQVIPGQRFFTSLTEARTAFSNLKLPTPLPTGAQLLDASWEYPPKVVVTSTNGRLQVDHLEYDIAPTLSRGIIQLRFTVPDGFFLISEGQFALWNPAKIKQLGSPSMYRLPNGRQVWSNDIQSPSVPRGRVRVLGWIETDTRIQVSISSDGLSLDRLAAIANAM